VVRKYSAQEEAKAQQPVGATQAWVLPVLGMFAMVSMVAVIGRSVHRHRSATRQVRLMDASEMDEDLQLVEAQSE
jgi:hypothetical protein